MTSEPESEAPPDGAAQLADEKPSREGRPARRKTWRRVVRWVVVTLLVVLLALVTVVFVRTLRFKSRQPDVPAVKHVSLNRDVVVARFALSLRHQTISYQDPAALKPEPFEALHRHLERSFPRVYQKLKPSRTDTAGFRHIARTVRQVFPGTLVAPGLMIAMTDSRHYRTICSSIYRFAPLRITPADRARFHGANERLSVKNYLEMINFYIQLARNANR